MKKRILKIITMLVAIVIVAGTLAGCSLPCSLGGAHKWIKATCTKAKYCENCGKVAGKPLGHDWEEATCEEPKHCLRCNKTVGEKAEHSTGYGVCSYCGEVVTTESYIMDAINDADISTYITNGTNYLSSNLFTSAALEFSDADGQLEYVVVSIGDSTAFASIKEKFEDAQSQLTDVLDYTNEADANQYYDTYKALSAKRNALLSLKEACVSLKDAYGLVADLANEVN